MKYIFIENPAAGAKKSHDTYKDIKKCLKDNIDCEFILTTEPGNATSVAREMAAKYGKSCIIFACGGDGTLSEVASGVRDYGCAVGVLPMGTGNDFAKKIYGDMTLEEIARGFGLYEGSPKVETTDIDCIRTGDVSCINVMSLGFDTKVLKLANKLSTNYPFLGKICYKLALVLSLFSSMKFTARFELDILGNDGEITRLDETRDFTLCAVCNASYYGGGFCPAKDSKLDDGVLDLVIAKDLNLIQIAGMIKHYIAGDVHKSHPHLVSTYRVVGGTLSAVEIETLALNCDGNPIDVLSADFKVERGGFKLAYFRNHAMSCAVCSPDCMLIEEEETEAPEPAPTVEEEYISSLEPSEIFAEEMK